MSGDAKKISIDGVDYIRADQAAAPPIPGKRAVVVVDRGWIFAGDVSEKDGRIRLSRALHVFSWPSGGFTAMVADPKATKADLRKVADVDIPADSEVFRVPVGDAWGL